MTKSLYDNEKVIFGIKQASTGWTNPNRGFMKWFIKELDCLPGKKSGLTAADIGCGAGAKTKTLKAIFPQWSFIGSDISRQAISLANKNNQGVKFLAADATKLPFKDQQFEVVVMNSVLDHTNDPEAAVKEVFRILKPKGVWLVTSPLEAELTTLHGWLTLWPKFRRHRKERCGHNFAFSKKSLLSLLKQSGFKIESVTLDWFYLTQLIDLLYYPILQSLGRPPEFNLEESAGLVHTIRKLAILVQNIESTLTLSIPLGWFAYVKAVKS